MNQRKYNTEDQEIIREILGSDKFLMLNMSLVSLYGCEAACMLIYILDKIEYAININKNAVDTGVVIYRKDFDDKFKISSYKQRKNEYLLIEDNVLSVEVMQNELTTYNIYKINLSVLYQKVREQKSLKKLEGGVKKLHA